MLITCRQFQTSAEIELHDNCLLIYPPCHSFSCICFGPRTRTHTLPFALDPDPLIFSYSLFSWLTLIGNFFYLCVNVMQALPFSTIRWTQKPSSSSFQTVKPATN